MVKSEVLKVFRAMAFLALVLPSVVCAAQAGQHQSFDASHAGECGPIAAYFACKYYGIPASLDELAVLSNTSPEKGTSLADLRAALLKKGLFAEGYLITPEALLANDKYFLILPVKEWGGGIDHYDVVMGSKDNGVLLLNYPSKPWFFPIRTLVKYWDGHALVVADRPIRVAEISGGLQDKPASHATLFLIALSIVLVLMIAFNTVTLLRELKRPHLSHDIRSGA